MKKDFTRDYVTEMFRLFARKSEGCTEEEKLDISAVSAAIAQLKKDNKLHIIEAVKEVYFVAPEKELHKGDISNRVQRFSHKFHVSDRRVYSWLKEARDLGAKCRGLRCEHYSDSLKY